MSCVRKRCGTADFTRIRDVVVSCTWQIILPNYVLVKESAISHCFVFMTAHVNLVNPTTLLARTLWFATTTYTHHKNRFISYIGNIYLFIVLIKSYTVYRRDPCVYYVRKNQMSIPFWPNFYVFFQAHACYYTLYLYIYVWIDLLFCFNRTDIPLDFHTQTLSQLL